MTLEKSLQGIIGIEPKKRPVPYKLYHVAWPSSKCAPFDNIKYSYILLYFQPPNGTQHGENASNDKKAKMQEQLRTIRLLFKRLRLIYEKCNETCQVFISNS